MPRLNSQAVRLAMSRGSRIFNRCARTFLATVIALVAGASSLSAQTPATAIFAGGCFWSMERIFDSVDGVLSTTSGYTGGTVKRPSYEDVSNGNTGHVEAVEVAYDPATVSYQKLLDVYWHSIDPTTVNREFCDAGNEYQSVIFAATSEQRRAAEASKREIDKTKPFSQPIVTQIRPAVQFWPAEEYHQHFYLKNPRGYAAYSIACDRGARLDAVWGKLAYKH